MEHVTRSYQANLVTVHTNAGPVQVEACYRYVEGLAVTHATSADRTRRKTKYRITHLASGEAIGHFQTLAKAQECCTALGTLGIDWTRPKAEIVNHETAEKVRAAIGQL